MKLFSQTMLVFFVVFLAGCITASPDRPQLRVELKDQQILVGEMKTHHFTLKTDLGTFDFDTMDAGELGPLEGKELDPSKQKIRLWLRNGSEFIGSWVEPSVKMDLQIGKKEIGTDVPIDRIKRLQFQGEPVWQSAVHRVRTRSGDDFFVDASNTQIHFSSDLFRFSPYLSEINYLQPLDKERKKWRVYLLSGSVLNAEMEDEVQFSLTMGPPTITVTRSQIEWIERQHIYQEERSKTKNAYDSGAQDSEAGSGFYSNQSQSEAKEKANKAYQSWKKK